MNSNEGTSVGALDEEVEVISNESMAVGALDERQEVDSNESTAIDAQDEEQVAVGDQTIAQTGQDIQVGSSEESVSVKPMLHDDYIWHIYNVFNALIPIIIIVL